MTMFDSRPAPTIVSPPTGVSRLFAAGTPDLSAHIASFGELPAIGPQLGSALIEAVRDAGLGGRGGAGFPTWRKIAAATDAARRAGSSTTLTPVVIANGAEGEPLSAKDATLLRAAPHLVIDGLLLVAASVGATETYLYSGTAQLAVVQRAINQRADAAGLRLREAPDTFISGEASAVLNSIERGVALPRDHRTRLTTSGLGGRPTIVQNVETLAHIALIARFGARWFASVGTPDEPGTRLLTITADGAPPRVIEAGGGIRIDQALAAVGIAAHEVRAVLVGGYHGAWLPASALATPLATRELLPFAATPGAGILMVLRRGECGLATSASIATYLGAQSARQCGPCVNGLPAMAATLQKLVTGGRDAGLPAEVRRLADLVTGRGSCHHPDGTARMVLSALTVFDTDVHHHLNGRCEAQESVHATGVQPMSEHVTSEETR